MTRRHTDICFDICFPAAPPALIDQATERFPGVAWFAVGFGNQSWFMEGARGPYAGSLFYATRLPYVAT